MHIYALEVICKYGVKFAQIFEFADHSADAPGFMWRKIPYECKHAFIYGSIFENSYLIHIDLEYKCV